MKKQVSPVAIVVAVVIVLALLGGLYYKTLGAPPPKSDVASPYGLPKPGEGFKTPPAGGSGINTITGEPLPEAARRPSGPAPGMPSLPPGMKVEPAKPDSTPAQPTHP